MYEGEKTLSLFRLCLSLLACSAIITQFIIRAQVKPFNPVNFLVSLRSKVTF